MVWRRHLSNYSWSSPTLITASDGAVYGVLADSDGVMHLFDPATGKDISTVNLGKNVEATPAVFGNTLVVASYDRNIYAVTIR
ncbi:MAG: PQQ-binding-like beta-propeller repeat protein [Nigerium sp.]|nr:PQQ-binding-like beta-propeller repeat protein [Nigerium sp.]